MLRRLPSNPNHITYCNLESSQFILSYRTNTGIDLRQCPFVLLQLQLFRIQFALSITVESCEHTTSYKLKKGFLRLKHRFLSVQLNRDSPTLRDRGGVGLPNVGSTYVFNLICTLRISLEIQLTMYFYVTFDYKRFKIMKSGCNFYKRRDIYICIMSILKL